MMPLSEATKAAVLEALEQQRTIAQKDIRLYTSLGNQVTQGELSILEKAKVRLERVNAAITEVKAARAAGEWRPVSEKFILTHDTGLVNQPKLFVRWNADDECVLVGKDDGSFYHCPLPDNIRLCEYIGSQEDTQE